MSLHVENVHHRALRGLTLSLNSGSLSVVLGRPGDGLADLAGLLVGAETPRRGTIRILGGDPQREPKTRAQLASLLPREPGSPEGSVRAWVAQALIARGSSGTPDELLAEFGLSSWATRQTNSLDDSRRRQVAAALAFSHSSAQAHVLFEPLVGLPSLDQTNTVQRLLQAQTRGSTVLVLTASAGLAAAVGGAVYLLQKGVCVDSSGLSPGLLSGGPSRLEVLSSGAKELARRLLKDGAEPVTLGAVTDGRLVLSADTEAQAAEALVSAAGTEPPIEIYSLRAVAEETPRLQLRSAATRQYAYDAAYARAAQQARQAQQPQQPQQPRQPQYATGTAASASPEDLPTSDSANESEPS